MELCECIIYRLYIVTGGDHGGLVKHIYKLYILQFFIDVIHTVDVTLVYFLSR